MFIQPPAIGVAAALLFSACSAGAGAGVGGSSDLAPATTSSVPTRPSTAPDARALRIGQQSATREGNVVKILSYQQPVAPGLLQPEPGMEYAAAEVEICAGRNGARRIPAEAFKVEMADGSERGRAFFGPKEPALVDARLGPDACVRGWVNFEVPKGKRATHVAFKGSSVTRWVARG